MEILDDLRYVYRSPFDGKARPTNMHWQEMYAALGLNPKRHLPDAGLGPRYVGNVRVWVDPKIPGVAQDAARVWCRCPHCGRHLTAGKYHQHRKVHR